MKEACPNNKRKSRRDALVVAAMAAVSFSLAACTEGPVSVGDLSIDKCDKDASLEKSTLSTEDVRQVNHDLRWAQETVSSTEREGTAVLETKVIYPDYVTAAVAVEPGLYQRPDIFFDAGINDLVCHEGPGPYRFRYHGNQAAADLGAFTVGVLQQSHLSQSS